MTKYNCVTRSSYFYVVDEFEYEKFKQHIVVRDNDERIEFWHKIADKAESDEVYTGKNMKHAFGGYTQILGYVEDIEHYDSKLSYPTPDYKLFLEKLSKIIAPNSACIITEVGNNALRYLGAEVSIVTHNNYETLVLDEIIKNRLSNKKGITYSDIDMWF